MRNRQKWQNVTANTPGQNDKIVDKEPILRYAVKNDILNNIIMRGRILRKITKICVLKN
jgi:hypothetical protein